MPTNDLSPAAEALLSDLAHWLPKDVLEEARGRLAGLLAPRWTACAEGLPEEGVEVLVWDGQRRLIDERENLPHGWRWRDNWDAADEVTHWTELPPGPEEGEPDATL